MRVLAQMGQSAEHPTSEKDGCQGSHQTGPGSEPGNLRSGPRWGPTLTVVLRTSVLAGQAILPGRRSDPSGRRDPARQEGAKTGDRTLQSEVPTLPEAERTIRTREATPLAQHAALSLGADTGPRIPA